MEIIVELVFEVVFQVVIEVLLDGAFDGAGRMLATRTGRIVTGVIAAIGVGFGLGWWWGARHAGLGYTDAPTSLFVSVGLAMAFAVLAAVTSIRELRAPEPAPVAGRPAFLSADHWLIWRWSPARLGGFALFNAAVAIGITVGFTPEPVLLR